MLCAYPNCKCQSLMVVTVGKWLVMNVRKIEDWLSIGHAWSSILFTLYMYASWSISHSLEIASMSASVNGGSGNEATVYPAIEGKRSEMSLSTF